MFYRKINRKKEGLVLNLSNKLLKKIMMIVAFKFYLLQLTKLFWQFPTKLVTLRSKKDTPDMVNTEDFSLNVLCKIELYCKSRPMISPSKWPRQMIDVHRLKIRANTVFLLFQITLHFYKQL